MRQDFLLLCSIAALLMWLCVLLVYFALTKIKARILTAKNVEELGTLRCSKANTLIAVATKMHFFFKILLIIEIVILGIGTMIRAVHFFNEQTLSSFNFSSLFFKLIDVQILLSVVATIAACLIMRLFQTYGKILLQKCIELGIVEASK